MALYQPAHTNFCIFEKKHYHNKTVTIILQHLYLPKNYGKNANIIITVSYEKNLYYVDSVDKIQPLSISN